MDLEFKGRDVRRATRKHVRASLITSMMNVIDCNDKHDAWMFIELKLPVEIRNVRVGMKRYVSEI